MKNTLIKRTKIKIEIITKSLKIVLLFNDPLNDIIVEMKY